MELYTTSRSANGVKALVAATLLDCDVTVHTVDVYAGEGRRAAFLALNPAGKVPTLVHGDQVLWESNAILQYLAESCGPARWWGVTAAERADVSRWLFWESAHWQPTLTSLLAVSVGHRLGLGPPPTDPVAWHAPAFVALANLLDTQLADRSFVTGESMTVADLSLAAMLIYDDGSFPVERWPHLARWRRRVHGLPAWAAAVQDTPWGQ
ncbi:MAG: glutathione S-transferase family protein [Myxococcales bacterium]|nr:glutathione S-transferase family protein [Myxococcales bacterium]